MIWYKKNILPNTNINAPTNKKLVSYIKNISEEERECSFEYLTSFFKE